MTAPPTLGLQVRMRLRRVREVDAPSPVPKVPAPQPPSPPTTPAPRDDKPPSGPAPVARGPAPEPARAPSPAAPAGSGSQPAPVPGVRGWDMTTGKHLAQAFEPASTAILGATSAPRQLDTIVRATPGTGAAKAQAVENATRTALHSMRTAGIDPLVLQHLAGHSRAVVSQLRAFPPAPGATPATPAAQPAAPARNLTPRPTPAPTVARAPSVAPAPAPAPASATPLPGGVGQEPASYTMGQSLDENLLQTARDSLVATQPVGHAVSVPSVASALTGGNYTHAQALLDELASRGVVARNPYMWGMYTVQRGHGTSGPNTGDAPVADIRRSGR